MFVTLFIALLPLSAYAKPVAIPASEGVSNYDIYRRAQSLNDCLNAAKVPLKLSQSSDWNAFISPYNLRTPFTPSIVTLPTTSAHVASTIKCANQAGGIKVTAKGGGHSYAAYGLGGENGHLIIDLQGMHDITYDAKSTTLKIGAGARLGNIADTLYKAGKRAIPHGTCPGVGVGGHSTHGGFGEASRMWGLMLDSILSVEVVTANGDVLVASDKQNTDLFWGIKGAAPNFGVVTLFKFKTFAAPEENVNYSYHWSNLTPQTAAKYFTIIQSFVQDNAPGSLSAGVSLFNNNDQAFEFSGVYYGHSQQDFNNLLAPLLKQLPVPSSQDINIKGWLDTLLRFAGQPILNVATTGYNDHSTFYAKSLVTGEDSPMTEAQMANFFAYAQNKGVPASANGNPWFVIINLYGGKGSAISNTALLQTSSYAHRSALWTWQFYTNLSQLTTQSGQNAISFTTGFLESVERNGDSMYPNYVDPQLTRDQAHQLYYGSQLAKLQALKKKYDAKNLFQWPQSLLA